MIDKLRDLNAVHLDVLKEIGNIASGNSATAISSMLNVTVDMAVPKVNVVPIREAAEMLGGAESVKVGIMASLKGDIEGKMMLLLEENFTNDIFTTLIGTDFKISQKLDEMQVSVIQEIGNIMVASYVNAIASLSGLMIDISVPAVSIDMVGALLSVPAIEMSTQSDDVIFVEGVLLDNNKDVSSNILLVPTMESLSLLLNELGIEV